MNQPEFYACSAFLPKRVLFLGQFQEGWTDSRMVGRFNVSGVIDYARKVQEVGGFFYLDGLKYRYYVNPNTGPAILAEGHDTTTLAKRALRELDAVQQASGAGRPAEVRSRRPAPGHQNGASGLYVPVTRKVSPERRTKAIAA